PPEPVAGRVSIGGYRLLLGDPAGATIVPASGESEPSALTQALAQAGRERKPAPDAVDRLESTVEDASQVTRGVERATTLFTEIAQGRLDPSSVSSEVDALVGLLRRLDRDERFDDALRVARSLAALLALVERWLDLSRSLQTALGAAEQLA
ncbi:MAG: hypothetical protein ACRDJ3_10425, partial [Solirubrobacteraceae bacterium]